MTKIAHALLVANHSGSTATEKSRPAPGGAPQFSLCVGVTSAGRSDVYCLTVPETAAFAVESGYIVHNCMDCMRYLTMGIREHAICEPARMDQQVIGSASGGDPTTGI
jgi:hypothetical protein